MLALAEHLLRSRRNVIFTLHRVLPRQELSECYNPHLAITLESFDHFLRWLRSRCTILPFSELLARPVEASGSSACAISFDDGWEDNHRIALPVMQSHGVSAIIYLITGLVGTSGCLPEERLWHLLRAASSEQSTEILKHLPPGPGNLISRLKELPLVRKMEVLQTIQMELPVQTPSPGMRFMSWDQVAEMNKMDYEFGSHTANHILLPLEDDATIQQELEGSKHQLDSRLNQDTQHFAFPSGRFDQRSVAALRAAGYATAVTTDLGAVQKDHEPFLIPRISMDNTLVNNDQQVFSAARARLWLVRGMAGAGSVQDYS
jgi:peptidoglycan/xylan/chitin deacetylase (PgdA/CDA1 family)